jgi:ankyrin repeat protein
MEKRLLDVWENVLHHMFRRGNLPKIIDIINTYNATNTEPFNINFDNGFLEASTLLHFAAEYGEIEYVKWLLANGADPLILTDDGETPLHVAVSQQTNPGQGLDRVDSEHVGVVYHLLQHVGVNGSDSWNTPNNWKITPLDYSVRMGRTEVLKVFLSNGAQVNGPLFTSQYGEITDAERGTYRIQPTHGMVPDPPYGALYTQFGTSLLHQAIQYNNMRAFDILMIDGANTRVYDDSGHTPLMTALVKARWNMAHILIESSGIDLSQRHGRAFVYITETGTHPLRYDMTTPEDQFVGFTALHVLVNVEYDPDASDEMIRIMWLLLIAGADARVKTSDGDTPGDIAAANGHVDIAAALKKWEDVSLYSDDFIERRKQSVRMALHPRSISESQLSRLPPNVLTQIFEHEAAHVNPRYANI